MPGYMERLSEIAVLRQILRDAEIVKKDIKSKDAKKVENAEKLLIEVIAKIDQLNLELANIMITLLKELGLREDEIPSWFKQPGNKAELREAAERLRRLEDDEVKSIIRIRTIASDVFRRAA